jgi:hypothetical protein
VAKRLAKAEIQRRAIDIREKDLGLGKFECFCPYELAREHGVGIIALDELIAAGCPQESLDFFTSERPDRWSAAVIPCGTGQFIVENTAHTPRRRRANISHEMAHVLLEHEFDRVLFAAGSKGGCHNPTNKDQEWEAAELGAELLIPYEAAHRAAHARKSDEEVADMFDVSVQLAGWRMNATGARKVARRVFAKWTGRNSGS